MAQSTQQPPVLHVVESFPKLSESFISGKVLWMLQQNQPVHVLDKYVSQRQLHYFTPQQQAWFNACTTGLYPNIPSWQRHISRIGSVFKATSRVLLRYPFALRTFQQWPIITDSPKERSQRAIDRMLALDWVLQHHVRCVHVHFGFNALDWVGIKALLGHRLRLVVSLLGIDVTVFPDTQPEVYRDLFKHADLFLASSDFLRDKAIALGCPPHKLIVHPVEIDTDFFTPPLHQEKAPDKTILISVGRLMWKKDVGNALQALSFLKDIHPGLAFEYWIIGDGPDKERLQQQCQQLGLHNIVHFLGALPQTQVKERLQQADIFVLPSQLEELGSVTLEAAACGLPVVVTDSGGTRMTVQDGQTGFLVPAQNPPALAEKIALLCQDSLMRQQMGTAGRQWVQQHFSHNVLYPKLLEYYQLES